MRADLLAAEARYPDFSPDGFAKFEQDLHLDSTAACPNRTLVTLMRQTQMLILATNQLIPLYLGMPSAEPFFAEHRLVFELLLASAPEAAALALEAHLEERRAQAVPPPRRAAGSSPPGTSLPDPDRREALMYPREITA